MVNRRSQEDYFAFSGGDAYFDRNETVQGDPLHHPAFQLLEAVRAELPEDSGRAAVLGGSAGREAAGLEGLFPRWTLSNVDVSQKAIDFGKERFPHLKHHQLSLTAAGGDFVKALGEQDVIVVVSVLPWIDRRLLARAIANIDESLRDGGYLLIADFLPSTKRKNPIRHSPEHYTYKQDYSAPFLALGTYELIASSTQISSTPADFPAQDRRLGYLLLRKDLTGLYPLGYTG